MEIRLTSIIDGISWEELASVLALAPLGKRRDPRKLEIAFRNSAVKVFAFDGNRLVGVGRALSDGVWRAAIYDVAVLPEYQGKGIDTRIIDQLIEAANVDVVMLYAAPGKGAFYERFGFAKMKTAMALTPSNDEARRQGLLESL